MHPCAVVVVVRSHPLADAFHPVNNLHPNASIFFLFLPDMVLAPDVWIE
jgi:hypothetical protein